MVGVLFALVGLSFFALFIAAVVYGPEPPSVLLPRDRSVWIAGLVSFIVSVVCILSARYFFKLDVNAPDDLQDRSSRFDPFIIAHRRELKRVAQIGVAISLIRLGAACFGIEWPPAWTLLLFLGAMGLLAVATQIGKPQTSVLQGADRAAWILLLLYVGSQWFHPSLLSRILQQGLMVLLFAWESFFFGHGEMRGGNSG